MAYEIPQQLAHKEKIMFGLNFQQLGWAFLALLLIAIISKLKIHLYLKLSLMFIVSFLAILFIYFSLFSLLQNISLFLRFRILSSTSKKLEQLIPIKAIKNNSIKTKKGEVAILQINPINFTIKTDKEQEAITISFQKFLNSLDFPGQFVITTQNLSIDHHLNSLKKSELFDDFSKFMKGQIAEHQMRNRNFYFILTKTTDLNVQSDVCIERFRQLGLKAKRLKDKQLLKILKDFFNDEGDERPADRIKSPIHYMVGPNFLRDNVDSFQVNNKHCRIISAVGYPRQVELGFLDKIISSNEDFDISIHVEPFSIDSTMVMLNEELKKQNADLYSEQLKSAINPSLQIKFQDTLKVLEDLQKGQQKLFNVSLYINCKAHNKEKLDYLTRKVETELNSIMIIPRIPYFRQLLGYKSLMPLAIDSLKEKRNVTTEALSAFFPFTSPFLTLESEGIMLGLNRNKVPFIRDIYSLSNANGIVLATSGSGKSYFTKLLILRLLLSQTKIMIIDPQNEYVNLTNHCKGQIVEISRHSDSIINPLDLMGHDFIEKRLTLIDLFKVMFGDLTEIQKAILDRALNQVYLKKGISSSKSKEKKMPILGDLYRELEILSKKATQIEQLTYQALLNRLYMYTEGVFSFLNRPTKIDTESNFICFNIGDMPKQVKPVIMFLILDYIYSTMKKSKERKLLVIDEAWSLLGKTEEASYIFEIVKTCRKFNLGLLLITQDVEDLLNTKAGNAVLANSAYSLLMRQKPSVIDNMVKIFNLSRIEREHLLTADQGSGILIMDNDHQELQVIASPKEHEMITTNADEVLGRKKIQEELIDININLDLEEGLFRGKNLSDDEKIYLANNNYEVGQFVPINNQRQEEVWVKRNKVESIEHTFLVQNLKQELKKKKYKVKVNIVKGPDLIIELKNKKKIAVEVETGKFFRRHRDRLIGKFRSVNEEYGRRWVVVLTNSKYRKHYSILLKNYDVNICTRRDAIEKIQTIIKEYNNGEKFGSENNLRKANSKTIGSEFGGNQNKTKKSHK